MDGLGPVEWALRAEIYPLQMLLLTVSGRVHRHQADVIVYQVEENRVLKEQMKGRALRLNDDQRRRLAAKAISALTRNRDLDRSVAAAIGVVDRSEVGLETGDRCRPGFRT